MMKNGKLFDLKEDFQMGKSFLILLFLVVHQPRIHGNFVSEYAQKNLIVIIRKNGLVHKVFWFRKGRCRGLCASLT